MQLPVARAGAVFEDDNVVAQIARGASRAFDAALGGDSADQDRAHAVAAQNEIEVGADETIGPTLLEDDIFRLGFELIDDFPVPRILFFLEQLIRIRSFRPLHAHAHPDAGFFFEQIETGLHGIENRHADLAGVGGERF